ncbi:unnamed protein product [Lathyrus oleraceus]
MDINERYRRRRKKHRSLGSVFFSDSQTLELSRIPLLLTQHSPLDLRFFSNLRHCCYLITLLIFLGPVLLWLDFLMISAMILLC